MRTGDAFIRGATSGRQAFTRRAPEVNDERRERVGVRSHSLADNDRRAYRGSEQDPGMEDRAARLRVLGTTGWVYWRWLGIFGGTRRLYLKLLRHSIFNCSSA